MERDDWYRNRILWKAEQQKLFEKQCCKFSDLPEDNATVIKKASGDIKPVIVFWDSQDKWTVLGTKKVFSFYDGNLVCSGLDEIDKKLSVVHPPDTSQGNIKLESNFIKLDTLEKLIWDPAGSELFALMNILQMFPLKKKNVVCDVSYFACLNCGEILESNVDWVSFIIFLNYASPPPQS